MSDGNLRKLFSQYLPDAMWVPCETWSTGQGVPDVYYIFPNGKSGWIENKVTAADAVEIGPHQIAWLERHARYWGRSFVAVRRQSKAGPIKGAARDELWLCRGADVRHIATQGLAATKPLGLYSGGPARWSWPLIRRFLGGNS